MLRFMCYPHTLELGELGELDDIAPGIKLHVVYTLGNQGFHLVRQHTHDFLHDVLQRVVFILSRGYQIHRSTTSSLKTSMIAGDEAVRLAE